MSIQAQLNDSAISMLPAVEKAIASAAEFESNQMHCYAIREINNAHTRLCAMTAAQINELEEQLINAFKFKEWL